MWRKIHSKRDPRDTIYSELHKEFSTYFKKGNESFRSIVSRYPKSFFGAMVFSMLVSMVLSFTLFRPERTAKVMVTTRVNPITDGFNQIIVASATIRETLRLKHMIDSISAKTQLSGTDSIFLDSALNRLQRNHQINK